MLDDDTLVGWEQDIERALQPSSLQQGAMWAGTVVGHLRDAIAELRRLRIETQVFTDEKCRWFLERAKKAEADLAACQAVVRAAQVYLDCHDEAAPLGGQYVTPEDILMRVAEARERLRGLVVAARTEGRDE